MRVAQNHRFLACSPTSRVNRAASKTVVALLERTGFTGEMAPGNSQRVARILQDARQLQQENFALPLSRVDRCINRLYTGLPQDELRAVRELGVLIRYEDRQHEIWRGYGIAEVLAKPTLTETVARLEDDPKYATVLGSLVSSSRLLTGSVEVPKEKMAPGLLQAVASLFRRESPQAAEPQPTMSLQAARTGLTAGDPDAILAYQNYAVADPELFREIEINLSQGWMTDGVCWTMILSAFGSTRSWKTNGDFVAHPQLALIYAIGSQRPELTPVVLTALSLLSMYRVPPYTEIYRDERALKFDGGPLQCLVELIESQTNREALIRESVVWMVQQMQQYSDDPDLGPALVYFAIVYPKAFETEELGVLQSLSRYASPRVRKRYDVNDNWYHVICAEDARQVGNVAKAILEVLGRPNTSLLSGSVRPALFGSDSGAGERRLTLNPQ